LLSEVYVEGNDWTFYALSSPQMPSLGGRCRFPFTLGSGARPATLDFHYPRGEELLFGPGIVRLKGGRLEIVFARRTVGSRPNSSDRPPDRHLILTLRRVR